MKNGPYGDGSIALTVLSSIFTHWIILFSPFSSGIVNLSIELPRAYLFITKYSKVKITSSATIGFPSDQYASLMKNVTSFPSDDTDQDFAKPGLISLVTGCISTRVEYIGPIMTVYADESRVPYSKNDSGVEASASLSTPPHFGLVSGVSMLSSTKNSVAMMLRAMARTAITTNHFFIRAPPF